jgi:hypothetical protein
MVQGPYEIDVRREQSCRGKASDDFRLEPSSMLIYIPRVSDPGTYSFFLEG